MVRVKVQCEVEHAKAAPPITWDFFDSCCAARNHVPYSNLTAEFVAGSYQQRECARLHFLLQRLRRRCVKAAESSFSDAGILACDRLLMPC